MAAPFGFGVGDFIVVGKLIGTITVELRQNGEAAPEYQNLLLELEVLGRALHQLDNLRPAKHELIQLNAIRATARTCQQPLQTFLDNISKFDSRLGVFGARDSRYKGFPRRMQWSLLYKEDVKALRSTLGSHVATINLLLLTQTVGSISAAENDRESLAGSLQEKISAHRLLLLGVNTKLDVSLKLQQDSKTYLWNHTLAMESLSNTTQHASQRLEIQQHSLQEIQNTLAHIQGQTASILANTLEILNLAASGLMSLRLIARELGKMMRLCTIFTTKMRKDMAKLMRLFSGLHTILRRIEDRMPQRIDLPIIQFTDALGETFALPYQLCQQWETFRELLGVMFINKPGQSRVKNGQYLIMNAQGGRILKEATWQHAVKQNDHLSMSIAFDELEIEVGHCPWVSCGASTAEAEVKNAGRVCPSCDRWAAHTPRNPPIAEPASLLSRFGGPLFLGPEIDTQTGPFFGSEDYIAREKQEKIYTRGEVAKSNGHSRPTELIDDPEYFRQIHVQVSNADTSEYRSQPLTDSEYVTLIRACLVYGFLDGMVDQSARELLKKDRSIIHVAIQAIQIAAKRRFLERKYGYEGTPRRSSRWNWLFPEQNEVFFEFQGITEIGAEAVLNRPIYMRNLRRLFSEFSSPADFHLPYVFEPPEYSCYWGRGEDEALLIGIHRYGYGDWSRIRDDPTLGLTDKIFLDESSATNNGQDPEISPRTPGNAELMGRANYISKELFALEGIGPT